MTYCVQNGNASKNHVFCMLCQFFLVIFSTMIFDLSGVLDRIAKEKGM